MNIAVPISCPPPRSRRSRTIANWFGLHWPQANIHCDSTNNNHLRNIYPRRGQIVLITGPSGAGKSSLLKNLSRLTRSGWIDLATLPVPNRPMIDCFSDAPLNQVLKLLSRVGLAEAWTYLRRPCELSEGQRWRLRVATGLHRASSLRRPVLVCDEFAALLDRVTAAVVSHAIRRAIPSGSRLRAILATSHDDLELALNPDIRVWCDFGKVIASTAATARSDPAPRRRPRG